VSANQAQHYNSFETKNLPSGIGEAARFRQHVVAAAVYNGFVALAPMLPKQEASQSPVTSMATKAPVATNVQPAPAEAAEPTILDEDDSEARSVAARSVIDAIHAETMTETKSGRDNGGYDLAA
jgi:hypothetical protein